MKSQPIDERRIDEVMNYLASTPDHGRTTLKRAELQALLLRTDGRMLARGASYNVRSRCLGAGVYEVTLEARQ